MSPQQRSLTMLGVIVAAMAAFGIWYAFQPAATSDGTPAGYEFPQHTLSGGGPAAVFEGTLSEADGCLRAGDATVIWPEDYSLTLEDGEPVVRGDGRDIGLGEAVRLGGGYYQEADLPDEALDALGGPCPGPFFLTTGFVE
jgi:hypothetical protein